MNRNFSPITLCLILFSAPIQSMEECECAYVTASWLPPLAFVLLTGTTMCIGTYLGFHDKLEDPEIVNRLICLEQRTKVHQKWDVNLAAIVPNASDGRDIVSDFGETLTLDEQQHFLHHGAKNAAAKARQRLTQS
ncbi:MAG: hypothetical protein ACJAZS_000758 [Alteromonas naphthalenivorans]|jgi:hypothetical protein